jgi:hypothetical protein
MKQNKLLCGAACLLLATVITLPSHAQRKERRDMMPLEHLAVSATAGTTGTGLSVGVPVLPRLAVRAGFTALPLNVNYTYEDYGENGDLFSVPMKAKVEMFNGNLMLDFFPVKDSRFHLTAGLLIGSDRIITVTGHTEYNEPIEIGDIWISPNDLGDVSAWIQTKSVKPYLGLGFGRTIPRTRIGFKFELGGVFQGTPTIKTDNATVNSGIEDSKDMNDLNRYLQDYFKVYPVLKFNLTYRIF